MDGKRVLHKYVKLLANVSLVLLRGCLQYDDQQMLADYFSLSRHVPLAELVFGEVLDLFEFHGVHHDVANRWDRRNRDFRKLHHSQMLEGLFHDDGIWQGEGVAFSEVIEKWAHFSDPVSQDIARIRMQTRGVWPELMVALQHSSMLVLMLPPDMFGLVFNGCWK